MQIGEELQVSYFGIVDGAHVFVSILNDTITVPVHKLFGASILKDAGQYRLKRNTFSQYTVLVA